jgi:hypothetical protein
VISHEQYSTRLLAEVAVPRRLFQKISILIDDLRRRPIPASDEGIDGEENATREMCPDDMREDQMAFHALADYLNHVIGWLHREQRQFGDDVGAQFPRVWMSSGEWGLKRHFSNA